MKLKITMLILFIGLNSIAQIKFEKGYYINNTNQKVNCLIKNIDWKNNPVEFEYKLSENSKPIIKTIKSVKEFGIVNKIKFVRFNVKIDKTTNDLNSLDHKRTLNYVDEILFLKLLVDGDAKLYSYTNSNLKKFFYEKNKALKQLEYKLYYNSYQSVSENINYKKQLKHFLPCKQTNPKKIDYSKKSLVSYFNTYNSNCSDKTFKHIDYTKNEAKGIFNIYAKLGMSFNSLELKNHIPNQSDLNFESKNVFSPSIEFEYIFPFNNFKWALYTELTYEAYTAISSENSNIKAEYKSLKIPIGFKHFIHLNKLNKFFLSSSIVTDIPFDSSIGHNRITIIGTPKILDTQVNFSFLFGLGYDFSSKYRIEVNYNTPREILDNNYVDWSTKYNNVSLKISYNIL